MKIWNLKYLIILFLLFTAKGYLPKGVVMADGTKTFVTTLDNGMRLVVQENHSAPVVALQAWVKVGSADESDNIAGISHLIEHMLFKGTGKRKVGEIAREVESSGGYINAFTTYDSTVFYLTIASRFFDTGLDILSDAMQHSSFDPAEIEKEKEVVVEEIKRSLDIPETRVMNALFDKAYAVHPYRRPIIGFSESVKNASRKTVLDYYHKWYAPDNITFVIAGDIDTQMTVAKTKNAFKEFKTYGLKRIKRPEEPRQEKLREIIIKEDVAETQLNMGFHIPGIENEDSYALDILSSIVGEGESSRLYNEIKREKELVNSIYSYTYTPKDPGIFIIGASLTEKNLSKAVKAIWEEIIKIRQHPPAEEELERAKLKIESDLIYHRETIQGQARQLGYFESVIGDINYEKKYLEGIRAVTGIMVNEVAEKYLRNSNLAVAALGPKSASFTEEAIRSALKEPEAEKSGTERTGEKTIREVIKNGATLIVKENPGSDIVAIQAVFIGGLRFEKPEKNGASNILGRAWTKGTKKMNAEDIAKRVESIGGEISGFTGKNTIGLSSQFIKRFTAEGIDLFTDILINPAFNESEIAKIKRETLEEIKNQDDELAKVAFKMFFRDLYGNHPYGRDILGELETVKKITRKDILDYYKQVAVSENLVLVAVGNFEADKMLELLKREISGLPDKKLKQPKIKDIIPPEKVKKSVKTIKGKKQTHIMLGFLGATLADEDRYPLEVLEAILSGQGGKLFVNLRDRESLAYDVRALSTEGIEKGYFAFYIASSAEKEERAINGLINEIEKVLRDGVTDEEVDRAKKYIIGNFEIGLQTSSSQSTNIAFNEIYKLGYDFYKKYPEKINSISRSDIIRVARKYLDMNKYTIAIVKPD